MTTENLLSTPSSSLKMNLQLFAEDFSDVILPDETPETTAPETPTGAETETPATDPPATDTTDAEGQEAETPDKPEPAKIKVKFLHEEKELTEDEAQPLIQKGMNYDRLQEKLKNLEADPRLSKYDKIKQLADAYQMSDDDLVEALFTQMYETQAKNQGLTPAQVKKEHELTQKEQNLTQKEQTLTDKQKSEAMYARFMDAFPGIKADAIKPETWQKVDKGMDLTTAYVQQQNEELKTQLAVLKQNEENAKKAPVRGGVSTHGSTEIAEDDDFLKGFNSI